MSTSARMSSIGLPRMTSGPSVTRAHPFVEAARHVGKPRGPGYVRDRFVYAPAEGVFHTKAWTGDAVRTGQEVAAMGLGALTAPLDGVSCAASHTTAPPSRSRRRSSRWTPPGRVSGGARHRRAAPANRSGRPVGGTRMGTSAALMSPARHSPGTLRVLLLRPHSAVQVHRTYPSA